LKNICHFVLPCREKVVPLQHEKYRKMKSLKQFIEDRKHGRYYHRKLTPYTLGVDFYYNGLVVRNCAKIRLQLWTCLGFLVDTSNGEDIVMSDYPKGKYTVTDDFNRCVQVANN